MHLGQLDVDSAVTAAGTTQATAQLLIKSISLVTTVAASSGVRLQEAILGSAGNPQIVYNGGANPLKVYPPSSYQINGLTANLPIILPTNTSCIFYTVSTSQIIGNLSA